MSELEERLRGLAELTAAEDHREVLLAAAEDHREVLLAAADAVALIAAEHDAVRERLALIAD